MEYQNNKMAENTETRSRTIIDDADRDRRLHHIETLKKFDKSGFKELMQKVELYPKFLTPEQVETAKGLILDGLASDAEDAYELMRSQSNDTNDAWTR